MLARSAAVLGAAAIVVTLSSVPASAATGTVDGFAPTFARVGAVVQVNGTGLTGAKDVAFTGPSSTSVDAGAPKTTAADGSSLSVAVPAGAVTGPVTVTLADDTPAVSATAFTVQQLTTGQIARSTSVVAYPHTATIRGRLLIRGTSAPVAGQKATLQRQVPHRAWQSLTAKTTGSDGRVAWTVKPPVVTAFRIVYGTTSSFAGTTSATVHMYVRPHVTLAVATVAPILSKVLVAGSAWPATTGRVSVDRLVSGSWRSVTTAAIRSNGRWSAYVTLPSAGTHQLRAHRAAGGGWLTGISLVRKVLGVNRSLHSGMSGVDVLALQRRLRALHYDVGAVTGSFGFDTSHAVVAFEKVNGMSRDGVVGPQVWQRLTSPRVPHLLHPYSGAAVEVDLTHQVLLYAVDKRIVRILDASTGGGYTYTGSDGRSHVAITPTGHFSVRYKVNHWVTAPLGTLYRPAYFNDGGYAIHGEGAVPSYPASHGCVRITVPAMDRLYDLLPVGLSVWIYRV